MSCGQRSPKIFSGFERTSNVHHISRCLGREGVSVSGGSRDDAFSPVPGTSSRTRIGSLPSRSGTPYVVSMTHVSDGERQRLILDISRELDAIRERGLVGDPE